MTYAEVKAVWLANGGSAGLADTMAAVAMAESRGNPNAINPEACRAEAYACAACNVSTSGDYSIGLWQINYYGSLFDSRVAAFGCPYVLFDPDQNAAAAVSLAAGGSGLHNWTTYTSGAYRTYLAGGGTPTVLRGPTQTSTGRTTSAAPAGAGGHATDKPLTIPGEFHHLVKALGKTVPTRTHLIDNLVTQFVKAVR